MTTRDGKILKQFWMTPEELRLLHEHADAMSRGKYPAPQIVVLSEALRQFDPVKVLADREQRA